MKKIVKRLLSLVLVGATILSMGMVAAAALVEEPANVIDTEGIEKFFSKNGDGTMSMDAEQAREAGYSEYTIQFVQGNIDGINEAVKSEGAIIDDDFKATIYFASSRARGQSKIETWATGAVLVYMNNEQADDLYNALANVHPLTILANMLSKLTKAQSILGQACRIAAFVANLQVVSYKAQIGQVKSNGTGIIMYVIPLPDGIASTANFGAQ